MVQANRISSHTRVPFATSPEFWFMTETNRLPSYAYLSPDGVQAYAELTDRGTYKLLSAEIEWKDRYTALASQGYLLRPRYRPGWSPSWRGTNLDPTYCEDSVNILVRQISVLLCIVLIKSIVESTRYRCNSCPR